MWIKTSYLTAIGDTVFCECNYEINYFKQNKFIIVILLVVRSNTINCSPFILL